jgi:hypothetical protein
MKRGLLQNARRLWQLSREEGVRVGRVHLYDIEFAPHESVEVFHRYSHDGPYPNNGEYRVSFMTVTGANWNGPIGRARFRVRTPHRPLGMRFPAEYSFISSIERPEQSGRDVRGNEIVFETNDWTPKRDLDLLFEWETPFTGSFQDYPPPSWRREAFGYAIPEDGCSAEGVRESSEVEIRHCVRVLYALHGAPFQDEKLRTKFYRSPERDDKGTIKIGLTSTPLFVPDVFSRRERAYLAAFNKEFRRRKKEAEEPPLQSAGPPERSAPDGGALFDAGDVAGALASEDASVKRVTVAATDIAVGPESARPESASVRAGPAAHSTASCGCDVSSSRPRFPLVFTLAVLMTLLNRARRWSRRHVLVVAGVAWPVVSYGRVAGESRTLPASSMRVRASSDSQVPG